MHTRSLVTSFICVLITGAAAVPASAQRADGPYAGVLGGPADQARTQGLDLQGSLFGGWDENRVPPLDGSTLALDRRLRDSGASTGASGSLAYDYRGDHAHFSLTGSTDARQYASTPNVIADYQAGTGLTADLGSRVHLTTGANAMYSPFYQFAPFLDFGVSSRAAASGPAYAVFAERNVRVEGSVGATASLTKRTSLFANATGLNWRLLDDPQHSLRAFGAHAGLSHQLTRSLGLHLGYRRDDNAYESSPDRYRIETIDVGVDYGDTL